MSGKSLVGWDPAAALLIGDSMARQPLSLKIYLLGSKGNPTGSPVKARMSPQLRRGRKSVSSLIPTLTEFHRTSGSLSSPGENMGPN